MVKTSQINVLLIKLKDDLKEEGDAFYPPSEGLRIQYKNLFSLIRNFLGEHREFISKASNSTSRREHMISSLNYLELILSMRIDELNAETSKKPKKLLSSAWEKLEKAGTAFDNNDSEGASNKLNTCIELALKDILDIPTTIKGINTSNIIDIMISEKVGPVEYLKEVRTHVILDNFVKHQGVAPVDARIMNAISATENLLKKLPEESFDLSPEVRDKLWSGIRKK